MPLLEYAVVGEDFNAFRDAPLEILAINGVPEQDPFVVPFMKGNGCPWKALRGTKEVIEAYGVRGFPHNVLIDGNGHSVLTPHLYDERSQAHLESTAPSPPTQ